LAKAFQLVSLADVSLDTLDFGGANSTYDALAAGTPVVTLPTPWQRGRYTQAIRRTTCVTDCIAGSVDEYVRLAARLGTAADYRADVSARLREAGADLFHSHRAVGELEGFFDSVIDGAGR
jgi:predicted O-linked N-acetylglucosamine transferase (SPINDLY family)